MTLPLPVLETESFARRLGSGLRAAEEIRTLQMNVGLVCNLACRHCHVESGPKRIAAHENMSEETAARVLDWLASNPSIRTVDITGGSPEMNPNFRRIVRRCRELGLHVMDRCNPTILTYVDRRTGESWEWVAAFLAEHRVEVVASLPCYLEENVDHQRGRGSYQRSIEGLLRLNRLGYGSDPELRLNLVYNANGAALPPPQAALEEDYRRELEERFGIVFDHLWTITNTPIRRWRQDLERQGQLEAYVDLLVESFNADAVSGLMCRHQIHIDSQGALYDCDFNHAIGMKMAGHERRYLWELQVEELVGREIATGDHCYACTAGAGSSCGGTLV